MVGDQISWKSVVLKHKIYGQVDARHVYRYAPHTTFRSTTDRIYDGDPIILKYCNTITLQLPTVFSTVTCTDL
jgi:hypothetical protein